MVISDFVFVYFTVVGRNHEKYIIGKREICLGHLKHWSKNHRGFSIGDKTIPIIIHDPQKVQIDKNWCTQGRSKGLQELKKNITAGEGGNVELLLK